MDTRKLENEIDTAMDLCANEGERGAHLLREGEACEGEPLCPTCGGERIRRPFQVCPDDEFHGGSAKRGDGRCVAKGPVMQAHRLHGPTRTGARPGAQRTDGLKPARGRGGRVGRLVREE